ncbi:prevent-host-death protein [Epilithonimonas arachidiradicis]|uniref:Prevent-host-death protein n=1 Tax=Epilithonimonas arachidiradicis TaxID=1617282 RepID=A0A420CPU2_9FLAO|nr:prevent-host-death protein [Epilithonimonas arachidiradicis]RKE80434.1 hypothetical protein BXY58_2959 [Epilithonimonas arachidiradicis]GGG63784.1 hypothetical protein GCM10007332_27500 [Epilithonimonas arachidiradicis]
MNYKLEINAQERGSKLHFKTIYFDAFKVNIIERYTGVKQPKILHIIIKLRTLTDEIINTKSDSGRVKLKDETFDSYAEFAKPLTSYEYRNKLIDRKAVEEKFVNFILGHVIANYQLN